MAETALITIAEVQVYRDIDPKINATRFAAYVNELQRKNLRELLGDALYYDFMMDARTSGKYADLLNGKTYTYGNQTIQYYGLKPALCYWWLAISAREGESYHSGYGVINFTNNQQQSFESSKEKERLCASYMQTAQGYANDIIKYLNANTAAYPLWVGDSEKQENQFVTFRI